MAVRDSSLGEIVWGKLHGDTVSCKHPNTVSTQLAGQVGEYSAVQVQLYAEQAAGKFFNNGASDFNAIFFAHCPPTAIITIPMWHYGSMLRVPAWVWIVVAGLSVFWIMLGSLSIDNARRHDANDSWT